MNKIFIDFDGVLVDTPIYIRQIIREKGNDVSTFTNINWNILLKRCNEIFNNISFVKEIYKDNDVEILTHVYSSSEKEEKLKYIKDKIGNIKVNAIPYYVSKHSYISKKECVLVDDYINNVEKWNNNGGKGILFNSTESLQVILKPYIINN